MALADRRPLVVLANGKQAQMPGGDKLLDAVLPDRLVGGASAATANAITTKGTFFVAAGAGNFCPTAGQYTVEHVPYYAGSYAMQWAVLLDAATTAATHTEYFRQHDGTAWGAWYVSSESRDIYDARYRAKTTSVESAV